MSMSDGLSASPHRKQRALIHVPPCLDHRLPQCYELQHNALDQDCTVRQCDAFAAQWDVGRRKKSNVMQIRHHGPHHALFDEESTGCASSPDTRAAWRGWK
jgi:hypothetical protein